MREGLEDALNYETETLKDMLLDLELKRRTYIDM
jgi:hypothetical protein